MGTKIGGTLAKPYDPQPVSDLTLAFPAQVRPLMPAWDDIPEEHRQGWSEWADFQGHWFFSGLPADVGFYLKPGIDGNTATRHLKAIQGSFEPSHEEKVAAVAYLASLWFDAVVAGEKTWGAVPAGSDR